MKIDRRRFRCVRLGLAAAVAVGGATMSTTAQTSDVVLAEALFRDGKELLGQKDYAHACPKLAESFRRDPATGTLLALAICHERDGKLASAWGEYADVASRSRLERRPDREKAAQEKVRELEQKVSRLTITVPVEASAVSSFAVTQNGAIMGPAVWGTALPVDGGSYQIEAWAAGKKTWRVNLSIAATSDKQTVAVPPLENVDEVAASPPPAAPPKPSAPSTTPAKPERSPSEEAKAPSAAGAVSAFRAGDTRRPLTPLQKAGVATGVAGVVGLGASAFFAFRAMSKNEDSKDGCLGDLCTPTGKDDRLDARSAGNLATIGLVAGGVLTAAGVTMYFVGRRSESRPGTTLRAVPMASPEGAGGVLLQGSF